MESRREDERQKKHLTKDGLEQVKKIKIGMNKSRKES